jgi:hypothetical protein
MPEEMRSRVDAFDGIPVALRVAWDSSPALVAVTLGPDHALAYQNLASRAMFGTRPAGMPLRVAFPELTAHGIHPLTQVLETGRLVEVPGRQVGVRDLTGEDVVLRYVLAPLGAPGVPAEGVVITAVDITAEARAEQTAARGRLLADLSVRLTAADDAAAGLGALTDALVPHLADVAAVYVLPEAAGDTAPVPPYVVALAEHLARLGPPPQSGRRGEPSPWDAALRGGQPIVVAVDAASLPTLAPDPASAAWMSAAGAHSLAVLPLVVATSFIGALVLLATGDRIPYRQDDLPFLADVAARAGAAIGQVRTQQQYREVALRLQRALLPATPPPLPTMTVAARYAAGARDVEVGGDWWDVQDVGGGQVAIGIGDVSGRGIAAAALMGQARAAMRAAGHAHLRPTAVLALLDAQLHEATAPGRQLDPAGPQFATACYGVYDPAGRHLRIANAGHLPILIRSPAGRVRTVELPPAAPLGLLIGGFTETTVPFEPGQTLAMFTDGLVETREEDLTTGIAALARAFEAAGDEPDLDALADHLLATMGRRPGHGHDDIALILARPGPASR